MLTWIGANIGTILIFIVLAGIVAAVIAHMVKNRKKGNPACGLWGSGCPTQAASAITINKRVPPTSIKASDISVHKGSAASVYKDSAASVHKRREA